MVSTININLTTKKHEYDIEKMDLQEISDQIGLSIQQMDADSKLKPYFTNLRLTGGVFV